jgi:hypothetical protein
MTIVSKAGLAAELRISRARVSQYAQCGMPIRSDGKLDRERALEWIAESPLSINSAYANKGAALAAQKLRPGHEEPPEPWLQPVHDAENFFDKGLLFGLLWTARHVGYFAALAAHEAGAPVDVVRRAEEVATVSFVYSASDLLHENKICRNDASIWPTDIVRGDWDSVINAPNADADGR